MHEPADGEVNWMSGSERVLGIVRDVVLPVDALTRYDVYFTDRRVAIICMGRADREWDTQEPISVISSAFGVPPPMDSNVEKAKDKPSIDEEVKGLSLDDLLKLSKKSCFYTNEEIEEVKLVWGKTPKLVILSKDCESKFTPDGEQFEQLIKILPTIEALRNKFWIAAKWNMLVGEEPFCEGGGCRNDADAVYCEGCGKKLREETTEAEPPSELTCSSCGARNRTEASFCNQCGTAIR